MLKFQYFAQIGDIEPVETESLSDVFNPWKNKCWQGGEGFRGNTIKQLCDATAAILSPLPLTEEKLDLLCANATQKWKRDIISLSQTRPDLLRWVWIAAPYMYMWEDDDSGVASRIVHEYNQGYERLPVGANFVTELERRGAAWNQTLNLASFSFSGTGGVFSTLKKFLSNHSNTFQYDGTYKAPSTIANMPQEDFDSFNLETRNYYVQVVLSDRGRRNALRTKLNHTADATKYLGNRKETTKTRNGTKVPKEYEPVLYGVELEISTACDTAELIDAQKEIFFICKSDASVSGAFSNNVELVTVPQDLRRHRLHWAKFMGAFFDEKTKSYPKFDTSNRTTNGQHVHVDRKAFLDEDHLQRFCYFIVDPMNVDFTTTVAERSAAHLSTYAQIPSFAGNLTPQKIFASVLSRLEDLGKYSAVNLTKKPTIEVRIFKGLFSYRTIMKNVEYVDAVLHFTKNCSFQQLTLDGFLHWLNGDGKGQRGQPKGAYPCLRLFLETIDLQEIREAAKLQVLLSQFKTPEAALAYIQKKELPQTRMFVGQLNNHFARKAFIWDNKNKTITLNTKDRAVLHAHDADALKRFIVSRG